MAAATCTKTGLLVVLSVLSFLVSSHTVRRHEHQNVHLGILRGGKEPTLKIRMRKDASEAPPSLEDGWEPVPLGTFMMETEQSSHGPSWLAPEQAGSSPSAASNVTESPNRTAAATAELPTEDRNQAVRRLLDQARLFRQQGNASAAENNLREALLLSNLAAAPLCEMLSLQLQQNKLTAANELLFRGIERHPDLPELYSLRGEIFQRQGELEAAERSLEHALALSPSLPNALSQLASLLSAPARSPTELARAENLLSRALAADPAHVPALSARALLLERRGALASALACYRRAADAAPESSQALSNLGGCLALRHQLPPTQRAEEEEAGGEQRERGGLEEAERVLRRAVAVGPSHAPALANLAVALLLQSGAQREEPQREETQREETQREEALSLLEQAVQLAPQARGPVGVYARALVEEKRLLPAQALYLHALALGPDPAAPHLFANLLTGPTPRHAPPQPAPPRPSLPLPLCAPRSSFPVASSQPPFFSRHPILFPPPPRPSSPSSPPSILLSPPRRRLSQRYGRSESVTGRWRCGSEYGGLLEELSGDTRGAAEAYDKALQLVPAATGACWRRAQLQWLWEGDAAGAEELLRRALAAAPAHPDALARLAMLLSDERPADAAGGHREPEQLLLRALHAAPDHTLALQVYAEMLGERGEEAAAAALHRRALALHPHDPRAPAEPPTPAVHV